MEYSEELYDIASRSIDEAMRTGHKVLGVDHIMLGIIRHGHNNALEALSDLGVSVPDFKKNIDKAIFLEGDARNKDLTDVEPSGDALSTFEKALYEADQRDTSVVTPLHLLLAIVRAQKCFSARYLQDLGISVKVLERYLEDKCPTPKDNPLMGRDNIDIAIAALGEQLSSLMDAEKSMERLPN